MKQRKKKIKRHFNFLERRFNSAILYFYFRVRKQDALLQ